MNHKLSFDSHVFQQILKQLSIVDSFKGNWELAD